MTKTIYDYPHYYDILFSWDRSVETRFYHRLLELAGVGRDEPILEVACGTGQIATRLAHAGWSITAMDIRAEMLTYLASRASSEGVNIRTICADMTMFSDGVIYGAALNPLSSFRLLETDDEAERHLQAMATSVRPGGVYVLDMEFRDGLEAPMTTTEEWQMSRDGVTIKATDDVIYVNDHGRKLELVWGGQVHLRSYTCTEFARRVSAAGSFVIESWHPEVGRSGSDGVSVFDPDHGTNSCREGRNIVVLRRL